jgi:hypothetical protein
VQTSWQTSRSFPLFRSRVGCGVALTTGACFCKHSQLWLGGWQHKPYLAVARTAPAADEWPTLTWAHATSHSRVLGAAASRDYLTHTVEGEYEVAIFFLFWAALLLMPVWFPGGVLGIQWLHDQFPIFNGMM